ncbi:unnamed protein product [Anisakis simplex]|uniref:Uncharacterized protein n=1 Tax=Anisakis simplex TaxID=6269 RepID=A0A0M3JI24_ANISI|nr:unnamed protein product [Anisakis simplex]
MILPECDDDDVGGSAGAENDAADNEQRKRNGTKPAKLYSGYCLRPYPPARGGGNYAVDYTKKANVKLRKGGSFVR